MQRHMRHMQSCVQEESHTSALATARSELQPVELAQQRAINHARVEIVASLEAWDHARKRTQAELEVASFRAAAATHSLARAREAEQRETAETQLRSSCRSAADGQCGPERNRTGPRDFNFADS